MTQLTDLAGFVVQASYDDLSEEARWALKVHILDALGCAVGALAADPVIRLHEYVDELGGNPLATLIRGGKSAPDRAALYNGALVRYLDFNDSFLAPGETCHPSDNLGAVLAASEYADRDGRCLLAALAVAYQVQCRLSEVAPVRARGFDHTVQGAYAAAAGVARALGLDATQTANAIAISGTANNALRVTRTGELSNWKGLAYPNTGYAAVSAAFLAKHGITGPPLVFEGNKGFMDSISGAFDLDWRKENLEMARRCTLKKYNAEIHSQSALEAILDLRDGFYTHLEDVERVELATFDVAYNIIGGGEEGTKYVVHTKEEADHSLPYLLAVAWLDGEVTPRQYEPARIRSEDVQTLLRRVIVRPEDALSRRFPAEMPCRLGITTRDGRERWVEKSDYEGYYTRPMRWEHLVEKFEYLTTPYADSDVRRRIAQQVEQIESVRVSELIDALAQVGS